MLQENKLQKIGGKEPKDAVRNAVAAVLGVQVGSLYTWHGLKGKQTLKTTPFGKALLSTFADKSLTEHMIGKIVGDWLRHESDKYKKQLM